MAVGDAEDHRGTADVVDDDGACGREQSAGDDLHVPETDPAHEPADHVVGFEEPHDGAGNPGPVVQPIQTHTARARQLCGLEREIPDPEVVDRRVCRQPLNQRGVDAFPLLGCAQDDRRVEGGRPVVRDNHARADTRKGQSQ